MVVHLLLLKCAMVKTNHTTCNVQSQCFIPESSSYCWCRELNTCIVPLFVSLPKCSNSTESHCPRKRWNGGLCLKSVAGQSQHWRHDAKNCHSFCVTHSWSCRSSLASWRINAKRHSLCVTYTKAAAASASLSHRVNHFCDAKDQKGPRPMIQKVI